MAKIALNKGDDLKAISYINEAIKNNERLEKRAMFDYAFASIKEEFIVSVKLDEDEVDMIKQQLDEEKIDKNIKKNILKNIQKDKKRKGVILKKFKFIEDTDIEITEEKYDIIELFSNTYSTINNMGEITSREKTKETVDRIFKQKLGQIEVENLILEEQNMLENKNTEDTKTINLNK